MRASVEDPWIYVETNVIGTLNLLEFCRVTYHMHLDSARDEWLDDPAWPRVQGTMERMVKEGKVLHWGLSLNAHEPGSGLRACAHPLIEVIQVIFNIFLEPQFAMALRGIGQPAVQVFGGLNMQFFTGRKAKKTDEAAHLDHVGREGVARAHGAGEVDVDHLVPERLVGLDEALLQRRLIEQLKSAQCLRHQVFGFARGCLAVVVE